MQFLRRKDSLESEIHHEFKKPETFYAWAFGAQHPAPLQILRNGVATTGRRLPSATTERQSTASSHKIAPEIRVFCRSNFLRRAIEINTAFVVYDETRDRLVEIGLNTT